MRRGALLGLVIAGALCARGALAEGRALCVEVEGAAFERDEIAELEALLEDAGFELAPAPADPPRPRRAIDEARFAELSKRGLVSLARGRLEEADALLAEALAELGDEAPPALADAGMAACLDRARITQAREGAPLAARRVEVCRRLFPFGEVDERRVPPEVHAMLTAVDARRVHLTLAPEGSECRAFLPGAEEPLADPSALPGVELELELECGRDEAVRRRVRFGEGFVVDVGVTLGDRFSPGPPARLRSADPRADAIALAERVGATVFVLARDEGGALLVRGEGAGAAHARGATLGQAAARLLRGPAPEARWRGARRGAAWAMGVAGAATFAAALAPMRSRAQTASEIAGTAYHDPAFVALRGEFDAARPPLRRRAVVGAMGGVLAGAFAERPLPRPWAIVSAAAGAVLLATGAALAASAPACDPGQDTFMGCLDRELRRDRALFTMMAATPLLSVSSRSLFAKGRGVSVQADPRSVQVSLHLSGPPGPRARDRVWSHAKE